MLYLCRFGPCGHLLLVSLHHLRGPYINKEFSEVLLTSGVLGTGAAEDLDKLLDTSVAPLAETLLLLPLLLPALEVVVDGLEKEIFIACNRLKSPR